MLVIRLARFGKKKKPFYRIVVAEDSASPRGKYIEKIGHYNPLENPPEIFVDKEKVEKWLNQGATVSDTVWNLFVKVGIFKEKVITKHRKQKKRKKEAKVEEKKENIEKEPQEQIKEESGLVDQQE